MQKGKNLSSALKDAGVGSYFGKVGGWIFSGFKELWSSGYHAKTVEERKQESQAKGLDTAQKSTAMEEETAKGIEEKASKAGMDVNIRILTFADNQQNADSYLNNIIN